MAAKIDGVKSVKNLLQIVPGSKRKSWSAQMPTSKMPCRRHSTANA